MSQNDMEELAEYMQQRRNTGARPFVLFLGLMSSLGEHSQIIAMTKVLQEYNELRSRADVPLSDEKRLDQFLRLCDRSTEENRYEILRRYVSAAAAPSGYRHLAELAKRGFFAAIITSAFDAFLEETLYTAGMRSGDFLVINAQDEQIPQQWESRSVLIIKLRGDLRTTGHISLSNEIKVSSEVTRLLADVLSRELIVVGYSPRDSLICDYLARREKLLVYANRNPPEKSDPMSECLSLTSVDHWITGKDGSSDSFLSRLTRLLVYLGDTPRVVQEGKYNISISGAGGLAIGDHATVHIDSRPRHLSPSAKHRALQEELEYAFRRLWISRRNLDRIEDQLATYGSAPPLHLLNQAEACRIDVEHMTARIGELQVALANADQEEEE